jgi:hypothetical protein
MLPKSLNRAILWATIFSSACFCLHAQSKDKWQRVYTGEDSVIDLNLSSSTLEGDHVLRVDFRTTFAKPENIARNQGRKYKSRIETIRFKLNQNRYWLAQVAWFDTKGAQLDSTVTTAEDWRVLKAGGVMERLFNAARTLPPFGSWKVVNYKFADGSAKADPNITRLIGTRVRLQSDLAQVGAKVCSSLAYEDERVSREDLNLHLGVSLESLGILGAYAETTKLKCEVGDWAPPQSLLLKVKKDEMLMLWSGVFLVLKRERVWTGDILPPLKRARG